MKTLQIRLSDEHGRPYEALNLASLVSLCKREYKRLDAVGMPAMQVRHFSLLYACAAYALAG
jgi:hypothetical protein